MRLPINSSRIITVVKPPSATPVSFCTSAVMENTIEMISVMIPSTVTRCSGKEEKLGHIRVMIFVRVIAAAMPAGIRSDNAVAGLLELPNEHRKALMRFPVAVDEHHRPAFAAAITIKFKSVYTDPFVFAHIIPCLSSVFDCLMLAERPADFNEERKLIKRFRNNSLSRIIVLRCC